MERRPPLALVKNIIKVKSLGVDNVVSGPERRNLSSLEGREGVRERLAAREGGGKCHQLNYMLRGVGLDVLNYLAR